MTLPTIHSNGTSAQELTDLYAGAMRAVREAQEAIGRACPNGRDYYPQGADANQAARKEHAARIAALEAVHDELEALAIHCSNFIK